MLEELNQTPENLLIAFEGPFNQLTYLSQTARAQRAQGQLMTLAPSCTLGSATDWDGEALESITSDFVVCHDNDKPGKDAVLDLAIQLKGKIYYTTTPGAGSDMDSYLKPLPVDKVFAAITDIWANQHVMVRPIEAVREELTKIRASKSIHHALEAIPQVAKIMWADFTARGQVFYSRGMGYYLNHHTSILYEITESVEFAVLLARYNLLSKNQDTKQVVASTGERASVEGIPADIHSTAFFDRKTNTAYLNCGNNRMVRITAAEYSLEANGTDNVLFLNKDMTPFWEKLATKDIDLESLVPKLKYGLKVSDTPLCREFQANWDTSQGSPLTGRNYHQLLMARLLTLFTPQLLGANPLCISMGEKGSGKTKIFEKLGWLIDGERFEPTEFNADKESLKSTLTTKGILLLDNADDIEEARGVQSLIASACTGMAVNKRILYTTNTTMDFPVTASIFISTRTNPFDRDDVADRQLLFPLLRYDKKDKRGENEIKDEFLGNRDTYFAEVIGRIQNVIKAIEATKGKHYPHDLRLHNFGELCLRVADHEGWLPEMESIITGILHSQGVTATSEDIIHEALTLYIGTNSSLFLGTNSNPVRMVIGELKSELNNVMEMSGGDFPYKTSKGLSSKIKTSISVYTKVFGLTYQYSTSRKTYIYSLNPSYDTVMRCLNEVAIRRLGVEPNLETAYHPVVGAVTERTQ